jgi:DNA-binding transcriptional MocR family regulator
MISFARGVPAPEVLPVEELADCAKAAVERDGAAALSYGAGGGYQPLRNWVAEWHSVDPGRVVLTNGSLQGFVFLAAHFLAAGARRVFVEAPTFQNPSGRTLSPERRRRLAELARERDLLVLEDDPYGLVRFEGEPPPTLFELDGGEHVAYSSSFSKTVAPGVRVGYLILPGELAEAIEALAVSTYISPGFLSQATVWEFIRRGNFEPNLVRVTELLRLRRDAMLAALERGLPEARWSRPAGGYFLWLDLPVEAADLLTRASERGVTFVKGADFFPAGSGGERSARLAYSFVSPPEIDEGIARLAELVPSAAVV